MAVMDADLGQIPDAALATRLSAAGLTVATASSATPQALGVAAAGNATSFARGNHVHSNALGAATATSINLVAITAPATGSTITVADGKTLTCSNTITLAGTDSASYNLNALPAKSRIATDVAITSNNTPANLTGLTANVAAGGTYTFEAYLYTTSNASGGVQVAIGGTATATAITYDTFITNAGSVTQGTRQAALAGAVGVTAVTVANVYITGTITVNAAGTLTVQGAQNASNAAASTFLRGSSFRVEQF